MSENAKRIIVGTVSIPLILLLAYIGGYPFFIFTLVLEVLCIFEFLKMFTQRDYYPLIIYTIFLSLLLFVSFLFLKEFFVYAVLFSLTIFPAELLRKKKKVINPFIALFGFVYITLPLALLFELGRKYEYVYLLFFLIWAGDTFAYFGGRKFGRTKFSKISPNKTIEGLITGFVSAIGISIIFNYLFPESITLIDSLATGILVGIFGPAGDLFESFLKRYAGVKDSSNLIPGHGGFLDRFDSLLFTVPFVYIYFNFIKDLLN